MSDKLQLIKATACYTREMQDGSVKKVNETYLVEALMFSEAEQRVMAELSEYRVGEDLQVSAVAKTKYDEVVPSADEQTDIWYEFRGKVITLDEVTAQEKATAYKMLVQGACISDALERFKTHVKAYSVNDITLNAIVETPILEIFKYQPPVQ